MVNCVPVSGLAQYTGMPIKQPLGRSCQQKQDLLSILIFPLKLKTQADLSIVHQCAYGSTFFIVAFLCFPGNLPKMPVPFIRDNLNEKGKAPGIGFLVPIY
jgi:hypothetical protein